MADKECAVNWWDGKKSHVCRTVEPHEKHKCRHCGAKRPASEPTKAEVKSP